MPSQPRAFAVPAVDEGSWVVSRGRVSRGTGCRGRSAGRVEADAPRTFSIGRGKRYEASLNRGQLDPEAFWLLIGGPTAVRMDNIMRLYAYKLRRREVKSALCVSTDRPTKMKFRVSDSAHPTDRPAARSAAKQILGRNTRPTDPLGPRQSRSGATFGHFRGFPPPCGSERPTDRPESDQLRPVGSSDRPTHSEAVLIRRVHF